MSFRDQDNLNAVKERYKVNQRQRESEAERLERELKRAEGRLQMINDHISQEKRYLLKRLSFDPDFDVDNVDVETWGYYDHKNQNMQEVERQYQLAWEWIWKIRRRLHELARQGRDDLQWIWMLERQQREAPEHQESQVEESTKRSEKRQQRAANWKTKQQTERNAEPG